MRAIFLTISLILQFLIGYSQQLQLKGKVSDKKILNPVAGVTLSLVSSTKTKDVKYAISDKNGDFKFSGLEKGEYTIVLSAVGYSKMSITLEMEDADKNIGNIYIKPEIKDLADITIIAKAPAVSQKDDTAQYSAAQYKVNPDATTEDLLKKMPGISIDNNGTITAHGEQVKKVTVDGKDFFGDDATAALKNIPANVVDKVQVFDRLSDQAQLTGIDDGNSQKSINIITKAGISNAQFGRIYAGAGTNKTYTSGGNISIFKKDRRISFVGNFNNVNQQNFGSQDLLGITGSGSSQRSPMSMGNFRGPGGPAETFTTDQATGINITNAVGINYSDKWNEKTTVTASYFFNNSINKNQSFTNNKLFENELTTLKNSNANSDNFNHRINARIEYKIDSNNSIFFIPNWSFQTNKSKSNSLINSYQYIDDSLYNTNSYSDKDKNGYNIRNNMMFRHSFAKKNRILSGGLNTTFTKNYSENIIDARFRFYDVAGNTDSLQQQYSDNNTAGYTLGGNISYNEPLGKKGKGQLQLEYNPSVQKNNAYQKTLGYDGMAYTKYDTSLSNKFENTIITNNGGVTYRYSPNKDEQLSFGVNYQSTELNSDRVLPQASNVNQTFKNILPSASWRKKISKYSNFRMFYRASTVYPTITQLQDVVNLSNPVSISSGNKNLKQSYTQYGGGRFSYTNTKNNRSLFTGIFFQYSNDYISNATYITASDSTIQQGIVLKQGTQFSKPINLDGYKIVRSYFNYSIPFKKIKTTVNLNTSFMYNNMPGLVNSISTNTETFQYNLGMAFVSNVSEHVDYNISYNAGINNAKTYGTTITTNNYVNHTISAVLNLLNKKGWFIQNELTGQIYNGLSSGFDRKFALWNAALGKKFFKNKTGELKISVFDILKQNQSISRTISNTYLEDVNSKVLQQYFMMTFSYNLKNFGNPPKKTEKTEDFIPKVGYPN